MEIMPMDFKGILSYHLIYFIHGFKKMKIWALLDKFQLNKDYNKIREKYESNGKRIINNFLYVSGIKVK